MEKNYKKSDIYQFIYWWIIRIVLIAVIIRSAIVAPELLIQFVSNLIFTFFYEIFLLLPKKYAMHNIPIYVYTVINTMIINACFFGSYLNWYYTISWYSSFLHCFGGGLMVIMGYEVIRAFADKTKADIPVGFRIFGAVGFSFSLSSIWEIFEFTYDQLTGYDSQHWSYENAMKYGTFPTFSPRTPERFALMDTMSDIVFNTIGIAFAAAVFVLIAVHIKNKAKAVEHKLSDEAEKARC